MRKKNRDMTTLEKEIIVGLFMIFLIFNAGVIIYLEGGSNGSHSMKNSGVVADENGDVIKIYNSKGNGAIEIREGEEVSDPEITASITEYFEKSFDAIANLQTTDITTLFLDPSSPNAWLNQSALDYLIKLRLKQSNDLKIINYKCGLKFSEIIEDGDYFEVVVTENNTVNFGFTPAVESSSSGIRHTFRLKKHGNAYVIVEHTKDEDSFSMLQEAICDGAGNSGAIFDEILNNAYTAVDELSSEKQAFNSGNEKINKVEVKNKYNPEVAIQYAMAWVDPVETVRNEAQFGIYDEYGGNCNNYISQCLNAGGIPMDYFGNGDTQWKWYSDEVNLEETELGRSPAWAGVAEFYTYARENTGYGLKAVVDDNVYSGSVGDVLQFGHDGEWAHSVIITEVIRDKNGKVLDYLINSNTTDRINYPASAYGYAEQRLIKIIGWNEIEPSVMTSSF